MFLSLLQIGALAYLGLAALLYFGQESLVFQAGVDRNFAATPAGIGLRFTELSIATEDGETLHGWHVPAPAPTRGLIIFFHGNAGNIGHRLDYLKMFHTLGFDSLIVDYRGYGRSTGRPSEDGTYRDAEAIWRHATVTMAVPQERIAIFGESLGGGVAAELASRHPPAALVLASTFSSVPDLGAQLYPWLPVRWLARIRYETLGKLPRITCPILVIHSREDNVIPFDHGRRLFEAAPGPKRFLEIEGGHNEGFVFGRETWINALTDFLLSATPRGGHQASVAQ